MKTVHIHIATPERDFFVGEAESLILATTDGEIGVLAGHMPTVVALAVAPVRFKADGEWREAALTGGFAEIVNDRVSILADSAEWPWEIEVNRAEEAKRRAEERLLARQSEVEYIRSQAALQRALVRLTVSMAKSGQIRPD